MMNTTKTIACLLMWTGMTLLCKAQVSDQWIKEHYTKSEVDIRMRDGLTLHTVIYSPLETSVKHPVMLCRTPYSAGPYGAEFRKNLGPSEWFVKANYIIVYQDVRGKYLSQGDFVDVRPFIPNKKGKQFDEASDTYDTVDWLIKNVKNNNGKVGVWGISYPGFYASMAALSGHPAVLAVSPQAPVTNWFIGDDFHHNGAFFLYDAFVFYSGFGKPRPKPTPLPAQGFQLPYPDAYHFFLQGGSIAQMHRRYLKDSIPFLHDLVKHPNYDEFWQARDIRQHMVVKYPALLTTGGLFDAEDCWGAWATYRSFEEKNPGITNRVVMGPWFHGGWARSDGSFFGDIPFDSPTAEYYRKEIEFPFFEEHLNNGAKANAAEATVYDTGARRWRQFDRWPSGNTQVNTWYFQPNEALAPQAVSSPLQFTEYLSDPNKPVPFQDGIITNRSREYMIADQRFVSNRPDVLSFTSPEIKEAFSVAGEVKAKLYISTTGTDVDFVVKIIDVFPDTAANYEIEGRKIIASQYQMLVRAEVIRARYRNSLSNPEALVPGQPTLIELSLPDVMHTFLPGHRMMIQVQSSWFPLVDRNPQQFIDPYTATPSQYKKSL
ncbi:MAG TPA: CocE/NonD family hydrolase, partial [Luteibaculaceae bacterium]|nr:CocE/NonD family hydrolase [Luteibaculaceae bacterium]